MFTWGSKYLAAMTLVALVAALAYGLATGGDPVGVISLGYKGGVGEHTGYANLVGATAIFLALTVFNVIVRDADAEDASRAAGTDRSLTVSATRQPTFWGPLAAFGLACLALGFAISTLFLALGIVILVVVALEWTILAWSERATGDADINRALRARILGPLEVPLFAVLAAAVVIVGLSRVLLTVSETGAVVIASVVAALIFAGANYLAKSNVSRSALTGVMVLGAVAVIGAGIFGAARGERDFHHGDDPGGDHSGESHEGGEGE